MHECGCRTAVGKDHWYSLQQLTTEQMVLRLRWVTSSYITSCPGACLGTYAGRTINFYLLRKGRTAAALSAAAH
jgi:hypothetical protein